MAVWQASDADMTDYLSSVQNRRLLLPIERSAWNRPDQGRKPRNGWDGGGEVSHSYDECQATVEAQGSGGLGVLSNLSGHQRHRTAIEHVQPAPRACTVSERLIARWSRGVGIASAVADRRDDRLPCRRTLDQQPRPIARIRYSSDCNQKLNGV
jgi:hypothetical protein